jgi:hypothetical protein
MEEEKKQKNLRCDPAFLVQVIHICSVDAISLAVQLPIQNPVVFCEVFEVYQYTLSSTRFEVLTALKMSMLVFFLVTPCGLVDRVPTFRIKISPLTSGMEMDRQYILPKYW